MAIRRLNIAATGAVQGVGFRPFVYRLASEMKLGGWVRNTPGGAELEVEGDESQLARFLARLKEEKPPRAHFQTLETAYLAAAGFGGFEIRESGRNGPPAAALPDIAACLACLAEIFDPENRRYRYPFTNCTQCGPRFTILENLPYDRPATTMKKFRMCAACEREYGDPRDRRFHAQPNACPDCGPQLELWDAAGNILARRDEALTAAAAALEAQKILAVKGIGGFHLLCDAGSGDAVRELRNRKRREAKPLALMFPSIESLEKVCAVSVEEKRLLEGPVAPIVLLLKKPAAPGMIAEEVASGNPFLGAMLPYSPLHHLLLRDFGLPVVATSGNLADEPIAVDEREALRRLAGIADLFLAHDRPIARPADDSVARVILGREQFLRRGRGCAPGPLPLPVSSPPLFAAGAHLKNSVAVAAGNELILSQHLGDLETAPALAAFDAAQQDLRRFYRVSPYAALCDLHPDYASTRLARDRFPRCIPVQHHAAHALSCMLDNDLEPPVLAVAWDGTGYGGDGTIWGGEFLVIKENGFERFAHFRPFPLPGAEAAMRQPRRAALGLLFALFGEAAWEEAPFLVPLFTKEERSNFSRMLARGVNAPLASSAGRLFDAVACLAGLRPVSRFEGEAAMELEWAASSAGGSDGGEYPFHFQPPLKNGQTSPNIVDWEGIVRGVLADRQRRRGAARIGLKFHRALASAAAAAAKRAGIGKLVLTGGCFQNKLLTELVFRRLEQEGFKPFIHRRIPPNDGGIAAGQVAAALRWHREN